MSDERIPTTENLKRATGRILDATKDTLNRATFMAGQYKAIVQHRIEIGALQRRLGHLHQDMGMRIDDLRSRQAVDILGDADVVRLLGEMDQIKSDMAILEHEVDELRRESSAEEGPSDTDAPRH